MDHLLFFPLSLIAGLPWTAWLLLFAAVGLGLTVVLVFYFSYQRSQRRGNSRLERQD